MRVSPTLRSRARRCAIATFLALLLAAATRLSAAQVQIVRVPAGGYKASAAIDGRGTLHLVYFVGEPQAGDVFYAVSADAGRTFSAPVRVNSQAHAAMGVSSARGPHLALGSEGQVHVIWMGSSEAKPRGPLNPAMPDNSPHNGTPLLYARLEQGAFTPQRNLLRQSVALDGDAGIAADANGHVYVAWHGLPADGSGKSEADRAVWLASSPDSGATFAEERKISQNDTGACACCGLAVGVRDDGAMAVLYRVAMEKSHRGMEMLLSNDRGTTFAAKALDQWDIAMCPMSTAAVFNTGSTFVAAWENAGRLKISNVPSGAVVSPARAANCKQPAIAVNGEGETLLAWAEGITFGRAGKVSWATFKGAGPAKGASGSLKEIGNAAEPLPAHGNIAAVALPDGRFLVIY